MNKVILFAGILISSSAFADTVICKVIPQGEVEITHTATQVQTLDLRDSGKTTRIYSRTDRDPSNRGGYKVSYCNPDNNEVSDRTGMSIYSHCKAAGTTDDVMFTFFLDKEFVAGKVTIDYLGKDIVHAEIGMRDCQRNP